LTLLTLITHLFSKPCQTAAPLEIELAGKLNRAPGLGIAIGVHRLIDRVDGSEDRGPRAKISIRICEIGMIECVVSFQPQLNISAAVSPSDGQILINLKIRIVKSRPWKKLRFTLPNVPIGSCENVPGLNQ